MSSWTEQLDDALTLVASRGRYHTLLFYLLCVPAAVPSAFLAFSQVFVSATPDHWCRPPFELKQFNLTTEQIKQLTIPYTTNKDGVRLYSNCYMYNLNYSQIMTTATGGDTFSDHAHYFVDNRTPKIMEQFMNYSVLVYTKLIEEYQQAFDRGAIEQSKCMYGWDYDREHYDRTLVTEYDMVCEDSWWPRTTTTLFWVGSLVGTVVFGWMSDKWGRRPTILLIITLEVPLTMITCFVPDYVSYTVLRTMCGLFFPALFQIPLILALELLPPNKRQLAGLMISVFFASAMSILAIFGYLLRDWFKLSLATSMPFVLLFCYYWIIPESPRWLVSKGKIKQAENVLIDLASKNGITLKNGFLHKLHEGSKNISDVKDIPTNDEKLQLVDGLDFPLTYKCPSINKKEEPEKSDIEKGMRDPNRGNFLVLSENLKKIDEDELESNSIDEGIQIEMRDVNTSNSNEKISQEVDTTSESANKNSKIMANHRIESHSDHIESLQKSTQTDPYTCKTNIGFRRTSIDFVTKLLGKDNGSKQERLDEDYSEIEEQATPMDLLRNPNIRKKFLILTFDWISNGIVYNGISYNATNLGVSEYLAFFIAGIVELPAYALVWWLMDRFGRKWVLCGAMATAGIACICCMFIPEDQIWVTVALAMIGKFGIAGGFAVFYVFVGELIPTVLRSQAMGLASFIAGVGLLTFPYIVSLAVYSKVLPLVLMGILSLAASFVSIFLPETLHTPLPQTVMEGELFGKDYHIMELAALIGGPR